MNQFLETMKARMEESQKRFQAATQKLQTAQTEHQAAAQEFASWQTSYQAELRRQHPETVPGSSSQPAPRVGLTFYIDESGKTTSSADRSETNKTDTVRQIIQDHPAGMTPAQVWKSVNAEIKHRPYLYSILKRLRDRGDVFQKRGKYFSKIVSKGEENKEQATVQ